MPGADETAPLPGAPAGERRSAVRHALTRVEEEQAVRDRSMRAQRARVFALALLSVLMLGTFAVVLDQSWTTSSAASRLVGDERGRLAYLRPLSHLVAALTETQSAAVRGAPVDTLAVPSAVDAVDAADHRYGDALGARQRWDELRGRINLAMTKPGSGRAGYQTFADLLTLSLDLVRRVGDTSDLIRAPQLDAYYVLDTALLRLPEAVVSAGRAADLALLAGKSVLSGVDAVQAAVARHDVARAAADANASITRSTAATGRSALGANLAGQLDGFRAAVDRFAPLVILNELTTPIDAGSLPPAAGEVRVTALALGDAVLSELDGLLAGRDAGLAEQRKVTTGAGIAFLVAITLSLWLVLTLTRGLLARPAHGEDPREATAGAVPAGHPGDRVPADVADIVDIGHLLDLAESGRAVGARHPGSDEHAG